MTLEDLGSVGEFIAAIATLATLLYLVAQIRQNTRALKSTSFMESQHYFTGIYDTLLQDPVLINLVDSAFDPSRQLSDFSEGERLTLGAFARCGCGAHGPCGFGGRRGSDRLTLSRCSV